MDIVCFCHLRWNFVYQRPQHLLSRFAHEFRVFVIEEPVYDALTPYLENALSKEKAWIITPHLPRDLNENDNTLCQQPLLKNLFSEFGIEDYILWYYTPMAIDISAALPPARLVIYDCMDELSAFKNAPAAITRKETLLFQQAHLVFTGGYSLYESKRKLHDSVYAFPSSIDKNHFLKARSTQTIPFDQYCVPHPRVGFFGVVDERFDTGLLKELAHLKPEWQFIIIGPVVKIDPSCLPAAPNIHYMGSKSYDELPAYLAGWDVAMIPFARNEATRFISPTKTPEYLAGGIPVVSTSIRDVINPYAGLGLVYIADEPADFIKGIDWALENRNDPQWLQAVDDFLANISWDITWVEMMLLIQSKLEKNKSVTLIPKQNEYV